MDVKVRGCHVTEGLAGAPTNGRHCEEGVALWMKLAPCNRKTKFEGHIEAGRICAGPVHLYAREIVDRVAAGLEQFEDSVDSCAPTGDCERHHGRKA
jgi:hypothetical protein